MSSSAPRELTVGELASLCRLTPRALRHYDQIGLLHPARVDPTNGYRYYDSGQIESASFIAVLRSLDIDVDTIGHLLDGTMALDDVLTAERDRRERDARRAASSLALLASLQTTSQPDPTIRDVPARTLIGTSLSVVASDDVDATSRAFTELFAAAEHAGIGYDPDGICVIRRITKERMHLDVGIVPEVPGTTVAGYHAIEIEGGPAACLVHHGPLESLPLAHARLNSWILDNGAEIAGSSRETFVGPLSDSTTLVETPIRR